MMSCGSTGGRRRTRYLCIAELVVDVVLCVRVTVWSGRKFLVTSFPTFGAYNPLGKFSFKQLWRPTYKEGTGLWPEELVLLVSEDDRLLGQENVIISVLIIICMVNFR